MWWKFRNSEKAERSVSAKEEEELRSSGKAPLSRIARKVKRVEVISRKKSTSQLSGEYKSRFKGQGMQFADSRIYQYGDDIRHIDWRTSARMQDTYVKTFEEERELTILFIVDVSGSTNFGSTGYSKRENFAIALASIGFSAIQNNDRVGLLFFSDKVEKYVPPKKGKKHILRLVDELLTFQAKSPKSDMNEALDMASHILKQGSIVFLASDFFVPFDQKSVEILAKKHDLIAIRPLDPRDLSLPNVGILRVRDPESGEQILLPTNSTSVREEFARSQKRFFETTSQRLKQAGVSIIDLPTDRDISECLHEFFQSRRGRR